MTINVLVIAQAAGESACRPGSVTPGFLTCGYSPGTAAGLRKHYGSLRGNTAGFGSWCARDVRASVSRAR
jgi:hypothetical protein